MAGAYAARGVRKVGAFRSGLEDTNSEPLAHERIKYESDTLRIAYVFLERDHFYTSDFL
ncbi:endonuclease I, partial [Xylella fastidiosa subsp. multiplex]|nr:endonuclease I [Xylella fastidiosa subsp. multiplex]